MKSDEQRDEFESLVYSVRDWVNGDGAMIIGEQEKDRILERLQ